MKPLDPIKEENIIRAVFTIAGKKGLAGINVSEISKEAGVGVGTLYTYFKGKEEIVQAAYFRIEDHLSGKMYEQFDLSHPVKDSLKRIHANALNYRLKHYDENVFMDQYQQSNYLQLNFEKQLDDFKKQNKQFYDLLKKGQKEGIITKLSHLTIISFVHGSVREFATAVYQKVLPLSKRSIEDNFNMIWKGISV